MLKRSLRARVRSDRSRWSRSTRPRRQRGTRHDGYACGREAIVDRTRHITLCRPSSLECPPTPVPRLTLGPMIVGEATTTVSATPDDVFDFVLDLHRYRQADHKIGRVGTIDNEGDRGTAEFSGRIRGLPGPSGIYPFTRTTRVWSSGRRSRVRLGGSSTSRARSTPSGPMKAPWSRTGRCSASSDRGDGSPNRSFGAGSRTTPPRRWFASRSSSNETTTRLLPSSRRASYRRHKGAATRPSACGDGREPRRSVSSFCVRSRSTDRQIWGGGRRRRPASAWRVDGRGDLSRSARGAPTRRGRRLRAAARARRTGRGRRRRGGRATGRLCRG